MANAIAAPASPPAQRSELVLSAALLGLLVVMLVPLPPMLLDLLLALNLALTVLLILVTLGVKQPLDFSVFPSLLLLLTLYRLGLNVATTRLVLLHGEAGTLVAAFGNFVVGGDLVVGLVIFLILIIIQFIVITKGAGRISEVAARFVLDSMPGKQMAIDAELNAGAIDEATARQRRQHLMRESEFYGTMDGASKFVRGDAIAAIIIAAINLVGGCIIGLMKGMPLAQAVRTYCVLTIGDGLISQIPALIIATAAGILVTKTSSQSSLGEEITGQFFASPRTLRTTALILTGLGLVPGLPMLPFLALAGGLALSANSMGSKPPPPPPKPGEKPAGAPPDPEAFLDGFLEADRIGIEIGGVLLPLVDSKRGPGLIDRIGTLRQDMARQGLWVPMVRVRDNLLLDPNAYRVLVGGREVARGSLQPDQWLAFDPAGSRLPLPDREEVREPAFGLRAQWIPDTERARAELAGFTVVDANNVLITHLGEMIRRHGHELLSREDLKGLVDRVRRTSPAVVDELVPNVMTMGSVHRVLTLLMEERVPVSNLVRILESLAHHAPTIKDVAELVEKVRVDIGRSVCDGFRDEQGHLRAIVLDPRLEVELRRSVQDRSLALEPGRLEQLILCLGSELRKANARGFEVPLLCDASLRRHLRQVLVRSLNNLSVLAYQEIPPDLLLSPVALVKPEDLAPARVAA
ncbi:MAG: flagellar biosynthesis protein FlhA [Gemmataceae bacterium]|nr:flagellar biosynthesis protein FlhA [Gemmataceae bacterium]